MVQLPMVQSPAGFAYEQDFALTDCKGDGITRTCNVRHSYGRVQGEPPAGRFIQNDREPLRAFVRTYALRADGSADGILEVRAGKSRRPSSAPLAQRLSKVHPFACIGLPNHPVGVGETWQTVCTTFDAGGLLTRTLTATVHSIATPGRVDVRLSGPCSLERNGQTTTGHIEATLFFVADAHEPHILRERITLSSAAGLQTERTLNHQFAKLDAASHMVRTFDGAPLSPPPNE